MKDDINLFFTTIFMTEAVLKITALGFKEYWSSSWNRFDFIIVLGSIADLSFSFLSASFVRIIRLFRISRMFRLIKSLKGLKSLFETLLVSLPAFWNVGALVLLLFFIYSYVGVLTFGTTIRGVSLNEHANFESFQMAMLTLFRISTNDEWVGLMQDCAVQPPDCNLAAGNCGSWAAYPFFITFVVVVSMILLNLFTAVIIENFENMQEHEEWKLSPQILEVGTGWRRQLTNGPHAPYPAASLVAFSTAALFSAWPNLSPQLTPHAIRVLVRYPFHPHLSFPSYPLITPRHFRCKGVNRDGPATGMQGQTTRSDDVQSEYVLTRGVVRSGRVAAPARRST